VLFVCCGGGRLFRALRPKGSGMPFMLVAGSVVLFLCGGLINSLGQWPEGMNGPSKFAVGDIGFPDILIPLVAHSLLGGW
jgi:hypothetical protein